MSARLFCQGCRIISETENKQKKMFFQLEFDFNSRSRSEIESGIE